MGFRGAAPCNDGSICLVDSSLSLTVHRCSCGVCKRTWMSECMIRISADMNMLHAALPGSLLNAHEFVHRCCPVPLPCMLQCHGFMVAGSQVECHSLVLLADCQNGG